jgi:hypothetical protein
MTTTTTTRFQLGRILATPGALRALREAGESPLRLLTSSIKRSEAPTRFGHAGLSHALESLIAIA